MLAEEPQEEPTPQEIVEEPQPEEPVELTETDKEYYRSISNLNGEQAVSKSQFEEDKKNVLATIDKLSTIMVKSDYNGWLNYITPAYKTFWSTEQNLKAIESRLPQKQLKIRSLQDYFKYVFYKDYLYIALEESTVAYKYTMEIYSSKGAYIYYYDSDGKQQYF